MARGAVSGFSRTRPYFNWLWEQILSPAYLKFLEVAGPKIYAGIALTFFYVTLVEAGDVVPSVADWLNLTFDIGVEYRDNLAAGTERLNAIR